MTRIIYFHLFVLFGLLALSSSVHGEEKPTTHWWEAETALAEDGTLILTGKPWWKRAAALKVGEHFLVKSEYPDGGQMLVRREKLKRGKKTFEAIVWVIDDDGDFQPGQTDGDKDSDCYVADYGCDGRVDRMLDYIDNDGDCEPDEMDIRYFHKGQLRISWFGMDLDDDGHMWSIGSYEYQGGFFRSDPYGDNMIYANRYDPEQRQWVPISECPFAFYDTDGDGESEAVVRVSAAPINFDPIKEPDPGNSFHTGPFQDRMRNIGAVNIRYGIDLDNLSGPERRLHYDLGFNLIARVPYKFEGMEHTNPLRRAPKTTRVIPHKICRQVAETYPAEQTGFSWHEYGDDAITQGFGPHANEDRRWEGIFWTWNRRVMHNTGSPTQNWNMRREFRPTPSKKRELYYSRVDRRIHLKGATDGWIHVGHLGDPKSTWGEIRMFDTNGDGYFDRWETYRTGAAAPVRISTVVDAGIRDLPNDWEKLHQFYTKEMLPEAIAANDKLTAAMQPLNDEFKAPEYLAKALKAAACDSEKRYVQDIIRESQYLALRNKLAERSDKLLAASAPKSRGVSTADKRAASERAWAFALAVSKLDAAYGEGRYEDAVHLLHELAKLEGVNIAKKIVVGLDRYYNNETRGGQPYHYAWEDTSTSGFSQLQTMLHGLGVTTVSLKEPASNKALAGVNIYIIVDPDTPKETKKPNYIQDKEIDAIVEWVRGGGVLMLLNNNQGEAEFEHMNKLARRFGITFNEDTRLGVKTDPGKLKRQMHSLPDHPFFKGVKKLHMRSVCTLKVEPPARVVYKLDGENIMAVCRYGKGTVLAVGDPWGYNEYINFADNVACLKNVFRWLIELAK